MAYFPNGTSAELYQASFCYACANWSDDFGCPIWSAHLIWNCDQIGNDDARGILNCLIPEVDGEYLDCTMFRSIQNEREDV